ncbi:MAG: hypothetical protein NTU47_12220 [Ignavibacteriales bacterium]|nr:hypothetical protein [Ignavibacteriales bacterium]
MKAKRFLMVTGFLLAFSAGLFAQEDLSTQLSKVASSNAVNYLSPLLSAWGADLNSGFYHSADLHDVLGFDIGLKAGAVLVKDDDRMFDFVLPSQISYTYQGVPFKLVAGVDYDNVIPGTPTALGDPSGKAVRVKSTSSFIPLRGQTIFTTPRGFDVKYVPLLMPQASIGLPFGLEVVGRFVPNITLAQDMGKVNFIGFGVRHSLDQYVPMMPIDVAIHFMTQKLTISDMNDNKILGASGTAYGIEVSKSLVLFTLYGGYQIEKSSWTIEPYKYVDPSTTVSITAPGFTVDGQNTSRFHAGVRFLLLIVNVHADYSFAKQPVVAVGVGVSFR